LFVVLDAYRYSTANLKPRDWDWTIGETQYNWFKQTLEQSDATFKFVFIHHVLGQTHGGKVWADKFEWGGYNSKGNYSIEWNGLNDSGNKVSSGVYFYEIKTAHFREVRKAILL